MGKKDFIAGWQIIAAALRRYGVRYLVAGLVLVALPAAYLSAYARSFTYVVYLDNEEIGYATSDTEIFDFVATLRAEEEAALGLEVKPIQEVHVVKEQRKDAVPDNWVVKDELRRRLRYDVYAYVIMVNDRPTLAVRTYEDYLKVINELKRAYVSGKENAVVQAIVLNDRVEAKKRLVDPDALYSADRAAEILRRGTDRRETYLVSRGDSLWTIARKNNMTVEEIKQANPQLEDENRLQVGEEISLVVAEPMVNVSVTEDIVFVERIPFQTRYQDDSKMYRGTTRVITPGRYGYKEVTYRITRTNGREVEREIVDEVIIEEPQTQVVARGTAAAPIAGTGRFAWPLPAGGRITSRFGPRWGGYHYGVDIGIPSGSAVVAADAGTVTYAGWAGAYGILVTIDHGNGYTTKYAHNSAVLVSVGQKVQKGQQIARSGNTGNSTGPHLHFEILRNGTPINPLQFF